MFYPHDTQIYDESYNVIPGVVKAKGEAQVIQDCFGFWLTEILTAFVADAATFIYRMRQVLTDKVTGTGEEIYALDRVYYVVAQDAVTANPTGVAGTDYYFCGWAKFDAAADGETVLINFDGTRYDENI